MTRVRLMSLVVFILLFSNGLYLIQAGAQTKRTAQSPDASPSRAAQQIIALTNQARAQNRLPPLLTDTPCKMAITGHVTDMNKGGFLSHQGSDGRSPDQRYRKLSPKSVGSGENLAYNTTGSGSAFMQQWLNSSVHRANILNPKYKGIGVAVQGTCSGSGKEKRCRYYAGQCFSL